MIWNVNQMLNAQNWCNIVQLMCHAKIETHNCRCRQATMSPSVILNSHGKTMRSYIRETNFFPHPKRKCLLNLYRGCCSNATATISFIVKIKNWRAFALGILRVYRLLVKLIWFWMRPPNQSKFSWNSISIFYS